MQVHCDEKCRMSISGSVEAVAGIFVIGLIIGECRSLCADCMEGKCAMILCDKI